jgi:hypothetical protein
MKHTCGGDLKYCFTAQKADHIHKVYQCLKCGETVETTSYKYIPSTCPRHQWEFEGWGFDDSPWSHEIYWKMKCDRCGQTGKKRYDSAEVGLRQAVDPQDPRVIKYLELKHETARFHLPQDDVKNFWEK